MVKVKKKKRLKVDRLAGLVLICDCCHKPTAYKNFTKDIEDVRGTWTVCCYSKADLVKETEDTKQITYPPKEGDF